MISIEATARAMFDVWHRRNDRTRNWDAHPDDDGAEAGRNAFRAMAAEVVLVPDPEHEHFGKSTIVDTSSLNIPMPEGAADPSDVAH